MKTSDMTKIALFTAIICILAPLSIPIGPIPISFTNLVLYFSVYIIGTKKSVVSYIAYCLLGIFGLPVFSGYSGGFAKAVGPTGGYLLGFIFMIIISGIIINKYSNKFIQFLGMVIGTAAAYAFGTIWYCIESNSDVISALMICVVPFIIGDIIKIIIALFAGNKIAVRINS
jgi:hypothetical protein